MSAREVFAASWSARVVARFAGLFTLLLTLAFVGVFVIVAQTLRNAAREEMRADLASFSEVYAQRRLPGLREAVERRAQTDAPTRRAALVGRGGETLAGDPAALPSAFLTAREEGRHGGWIGASRPLLGGFTLIVAHDRSADEALLRSLALALAGLGVVAALFGVAGGLVVGRGALGRVETINATLARAAQGDLSARVGEADARDEFGMLARGVDAALARLAALVGGLKAIAERVAHEMRSPLGHLRSGLDVARAAARQGESGPQMAERLAALREEVDEMIAIFGALLDVTLTEASAGDRSGLARVDLGHVVAEVVELYEAVAEDRGVRIQTRAAPVATLGEARLLTRLLANLVDNAVKFSAPGGTVEVSVERRGADAVLSVRDHGAGLPQGFAESAFELFTRAPQAAATPGHGLGLALVRAIAVRHGFRLRLEDAAPGLRVVVSGPAEA